MSCDREKNLSAYMDNELSEMLKIQLENHLESCPKCKERLQLYNRIQTFSQPLREISSPYYLSSKTINIINEQSREKSFFPFITDLAQKSYLRFGLISTLIVFIILIGLFTFKSLDSSKMYKRISQAKQKDLFTHDNSQGTSKIEFDKSLVGYLFSSNKLDFEGDAPLRDLAMLYNYEKVENRKVFDTITFYFDNSQQPKLESHFDW